MMTASTSNPFQSLYITERISPKEYVHVISDKLVPHATPLFDIGNVILEGTPGCGKTTLLALLKPEIRAAYYDNGMAFPVPHELSNFICPGISILKSGALDIGKRPIINETDEMQTFPLFFADFINYHVCYDLLNALQYLATLPYAEPIVRGRHFNKFARELSKEDCWFGYLDGIGTFEELITKFRNRISAYRSFHQFNSQKLPCGINDTKTAIGEPISRMANVLKKSKTIDEKTNIFVRIDQLESLVGCDELRGELGRLYRRVINTALNSRDPNISYKVGTRTYAWHKELRVYNAEDKLEESRSHHIINITEMLRRKENADKELFPSFALDVFYRRMDFYNLISKDIKDALKSHDQSKNKSKSTTNNESILLHKKFARTVFGPKKTDKDLARQYCQNSGFEKALKLNNLFTQEEYRELEALYRENPLEAILEKASLLQSKTNKSLSDRLQSTKSSGRTKTYWRKERVSLALMQLASNCSQKPIWTGIERILSLSSEGILEFLVLCKCIWEVLLREPRRKSVVFGLLKEEFIPEGIQSIGILTASRKWINKIDELPSGNELRAYIENIGEFFKSKLSDDQKMSYPGHNGFSLRQTRSIIINADLEAFWNFLREATDYGVLYEVRHTSKEKRKRFRTKWYLNPLYYPYFDMYESRKKEPFYATPEQMISIINGFGSTMAEKSRGEIKRKQNNIDDGGLFKGVDYGKGT